MFAGQAQLWKDKISPRHQSSVHSPAPWGTVGAEAEAPDATDPIPVLQPPGHLEASAAEVAGTLDSSTALKVPTELPVWVTCVLPP